MIFGVPITKHSKYCGKYPAVASTFPLNYTHTGIKLNPGVFLQILVVNISYPPHPRTLLNLFVKNFTTSWNVS
jgi:hypothetical protein